MNFLPASTPIPEGVREGVLVSLPLVNEIADEGLRAKVVEAWALSLTLNDYERIEQIPGSGMPEAPVKGDQTHHLLGVGYIALGIKDALERVFGTPLGIERDLLIAAALCHDVGKPFEYNPANRARWSADPRVSGEPSIRHPAYGVFIAMTVGLPEEVVHVCGYHSPEGRFVERSLAGTIVHHADDAYWFILEKAENWEQKVPRL